MYHHTPLCIMPLPGLGQWQARFAQKDGPMRIPHLIPEVHLYLVQDHTVLLMQRCNTGYQDGRYGLVAGHVEPGEDFVDAIVRETREEVGLVIAPEALEVAPVMYRLKIGDDRIAGFARVRHWQGEPRIMEPEKCDDLQWFPLDALPANMVPYVRQCITYIQQGIYYSRMDGTNDQHDRKKLFFCHNLAVSYD